MDYRKELLDKKYIGEWDLVNGALTVTIKGVKREKIQPRNEVKPVIYFKEANPHIAPTCNLKVIAKLYGKETENWIGKKVTFYYDPRVKFGSDTVGGLRIKDIVPAEEKSAGECSVCHKPIFGAFNMDAETWVKYCTSKKGVPLCGPCSKTYMAPVEEVQT